jgi:hypothetical protein
MSESRDLSVTTVRLNDVLVLSTPGVMRNEQKDAYMKWFTDALKGTSLEGCRVILLDGGADVQVFRGEHLKD